MKATGIIRRIDDLGRIVLPKELRKTTFIKSGDPIEIFTDTDGSIILKKYSIMGSINTWAELCANTLNKTLKRPIMISDGLKVLYSIGIPGKRHLSYSLSEDVVELIDERSFVPNLDLKAFTIDKDLVTIETIAPIITNGDLAGAILVGKSEANNPINEESIKTVTMIIEGLLNNE